MLKICRLLTLYFTFGIFCLPLGDFSFLPHLPEMYRHCKTYEDKDMNVFDFISDHLINFDCLSDDHGGGDEQKPHRPADYRPVSSSMHYFLQVDKEDPCGPTADFELPSAQVHSEVLDGQKSRVFRPPIS